MKIKKTIIILLFLLAAQTASAGLGISPSRLTVKHLLRGSGYEKTFVLSRSNPDEDVLLKVSVDGIVKDWLTIDKGEEFIMPKGSQRFPIKVIVEAPNDIPNGQYKGTIRLVSTPQSQKIADGSSASAVLAVAIQVDLTISGDEVLEYTISAISAETIEQGWPIRIFLTLNNTGNVKARPSKVDVEIYDKFKTSLLSSHQITEMGFADAFKQDDIILEIQNELEKEQYWAKVSVYGNNGLLREESVVFEVVELGSLDKQGVLEELTSKNKFELGEIVKVSGLLKNIGQVAFSAKLVLEIYQEGKLLDLAEGEILNIRAGERKNLEAFFKPSEIGQYIVRGYGVYAGKTTSAKELTFNVSGSLFAARLSIFSSLGGIIAGAVILIVILGALLLFKRSKRK